MTLDASLNRWATATALFLCVVGTAHADSMRCGKQLVGDGDSLITVKSRCGEPDTQIHRTELRTVRRYVSGPCSPGSTQICSQGVDHTVEVSIDEWAYDFGPHKFIHHLRFENGILIRVATGDRGSKH